MRYNWQQTDWPHFTWNLQGMEASFLQFSADSGRMEGLLSGLPHSLQSDALIALMVEEAIKTSAIEGEIISRPDVFSSIRRQLGLDGASAATKNKKARGLAEIMLDVRKTFAAKLTRQKLMTWHQLLFPSQPHPKHPIIIGSWRTHPEPMLVVSGPIGHEKIHFEAPPSDRVPSEMHSFIHWFNRTGPDGPDEIPVPLLRAAIAHLYFESIHPFEDGNGRIGRVIAEKALAQGLGRPVLLSLSRTIEAHKAAYYQALKTAQRSNDVTAFVQYFTKIALQAQRDAENDVRFILKKTQFLDQFRIMMNVRQEKVVLRMLSGGSKGFTGGMNARKYMALTGTSKATATRDLGELLKWGVLKQIAAGRSTAYELTL